MAHLKVFKIVFLSFTVHLGKNRQPPPCHILNMVLLEISSMRSVCPLETQLYSVSQGTQKWICAFLLKLSMNLCLDLRIYWTYISFQRLVSVQPGTHNCDPPYLSWFSVSHFFLLVTQIIWERSTINFEFASVLINVLNLFFVWAMYSKSLCKWKSLCNFPNFIYFKITYCSISVFLIFEIIMTTLLSSFSSL